MVSLTDLVSICGAPITIDMSPSSCSSRSSGLCSTYSSPDEVRSTATETRRKPCTVEPSSGLSSTTHWPKSSCPSLSYTVVTSSRNLPIIRFLMKPDASSTVTDSLASSKSWRESDSVNSFVSSQYALLVFSFFSVHFSRSTFPKCSATFAIGLQNESPSAPRSCRASITCTRIW